MLKRTRTHTHTDMRTRTHTQTCRKGPSTRFRGSASEPEATAAVRCPDRLRIQCKVSELTEITVCLCASAPSCLSEGTHEAPGRQERPETVSWRSLSHWIDFCFFFMIEKSSLVHRTLITMEQPTRLLRKCQVFLTKTLTVRKIMTFGFFTWPRTCR